jgi:thiamine-monophosphate kinase
MVHLRPKPAPPADIQNREQAMIAEIFKPLANDRHAYGLTDDAAALRPPANKDLVITTDTLVANVHFPVAGPPDEIAKKALRVNLSDLAAKAAKPKYYMINIALTAQQDLGWLKRFAQGLADDQSEYKITLLGGDTVRTPGALTISITAIGELPKGAMVLRSRARAGNLIYVTGTIGDAALGLDLALQRPGPARTLSVHDRRYLMQRYGLPEPRLGLAGALRKHATAAMDVSDGLAGDLALLCRASNVSARVALADMPLSGPAQKCLREDGGLLTRFATGGDDYERLCTVKPAQAKPFEQAAKRAGIPVTRIGTIGRANEPLVFLEASGAEARLETLSYSHI